MKSHISATQAARTFSALLNRVHYQGEEFVIERSGEPVCRIIPVQPAARSLADFVHLLCSIPKPDPGYWDTVEAVTVQQPVLSESPWEY